MDSTWMIGKTLMDKLRKGLTTMRERTNLCIESIIKIFTLMTTYHCKPFLDRHIANHLCVIEGQSF